MGLLLQAKALHQRAGERVLFEDLTLAVGSGDRLGLVGHNGSGKTTLLDILAGRRVPEAGEVSVRRGARVALVEQFLTEKLRARTAVDCVADKVPDAAAWRAESLLAAFRFPESAYATPTGVLSGGEQNRIMFARALASEPDLVLLDEPTNHLDMATLLTFEAVLTQFRGAFVLVSHDRTFLDAVCSATIFLRDEQLHRFALPYSEARAALAAQDAAAARSRAAEERRIAALRESANRLASWGKVYDSEKFARRARSMGRRIERMEEAKTYVSEGSPLDLKLRLGSTRARQVVTAKNMAISVAGRTLFTIDELLIRPGERVALLGPNGAGKSTLIKSLVAAFRGNDEGFAFGPQTTLGYYDQELEEVHGAMSVRRFVTERTSRGEQAVIADLVNAGFAYNDHGKAVRDLSGGERARLLFLVLSLNRPNFLVLDEPTNHIDIEGREQLEAALLASEAALLITSHDRQFLEHLAERFLTIEDGRLEELTSLAAYLDRAAEPFEAKTRGAPTTSAPDERDPLPAAEDDILARIIALEETLAADLARRPKFQKPSRQAEWRAQLAALYARLEEEDNR